MPSWLARKFNSRHRPPGWPWRLGGAGGSATEFALVAPVFFLLLLSAFEFAYDQFLQEVLDSTLSATANEVAIGTTQTATSSNFVSSYVCPNAISLMNCKSLYVRVETLAFTPTTACNDFYDAAGGGLPVSNGVLQLGAFYNGAGTSGVGAATPPATDCDIDSSDTSFVDPGPEQCVLMTGIYVEPSFLDGLILNKLTYNGQVVGAQFSTITFVTEPYPSPNSQTTTPC